MATRVAAAAPDDALRAPSHPDDDAASGASSSMAALIPPRTSNADGSGPVPDIQITSSSPTSTAPNALPRRPGAGAGGGGVNRRASQLRRSAMDNRAGNRLSGFFSNLFHGPAAGPPAASTSKEQESDSPQPSSRPTTPPPPALPPPTLEDLGLSLSAITSELYAGPPASGTFIAPHYILLCHSHGLDVLPLAGPVASAATPLPLIRRVAFKSVVVMEERGVLVAIAGRRDAVRVYALEEIRRLIDWRIDVEARKMHRSARSASSAKRATFTLPTPPPPLPTRNAARAKADVPRDSPPAYSPPALRVSRSNQSLSMSERPGPPVSVQRPSTAHGASGGSSNTSTPPTIGRATTTSSSLSAALAPRQRHPSVSTIVAPRMTSSAHIPPPPLPAGAASASMAAEARNAEDIDNDENKRGGDWMEDPNSDEEALVAAGPSGSAALDERTSAAARGPSMDSTVTSGTSTGIDSARPSISSVPTMTTTTTTSTITNGHARTMSATMTRPRRPSNLDLSAAAPNGNGAAAEPPSPAPTLLTLQQALQHTLSAQRAQHTRSRPSVSSGSGVRGIHVSEDGGLVSDDADPDVEDIDEGDDTDMESTRPVRRREQITFAQALAESRIPTAPPLGSRSGPTTSGLPPHPAVVPPVPRRRWSVDQRQAPAPVVSAQIQHSPSTPPAMPRSASPIPSPSRASSMHNDRAQRHRFLPRIITAAFRGSSDMPRAGRASEADLPGEESDMDKGFTSTPFTGTAGAAPKLDFVKLPGTKGAVLVKAVETARKSFLAILCGDAGEKVELFAGTYKTALGLSRTFILPDSPRSLELQLQGDDLVEIFLVFGQNVFGLEPATVRVREVRIGRAERRARRRARQQREDGEEEVGVSVTVAVEGSEENGGTGTATNAPPTPASETPNPTPVTTTASLTNTPTNVSDEDEQMGPYTTFQQLSFAPAFPLGTIADECIIPPSYPAFMHYKETWEADQPAPDTHSDVGVDATGLSPPGLPTPPSMPPSRWYYRDPKGVVQGPFKGAMMQGWFKDGYLPLDLPVRREGETEYILLRDLRSQSVDPTLPFRPPPPPLTPPEVDPPPPRIIPSNPKPLLQPVSLLKQPRHFGPPALFFSSRGGHSTSIVDARGKSVLKGRLHWSAPVSLAGEVRRVEAFDVRDRAVVVALRRSALEAVDVGDALLCPGDESRMLLPDYTVPTTSTSRRSAFVWRIGAPLNAPAPGHLRSESTPNLVGLPRGRKEKNDWVSMLEHDLGADNGAGAGSSKHASQEEVLFLGREGDNVFFCEKGAGYFRVLRLAPS